MVPTPDRAVWLGRSYRIARIESIEHQTRESEGILLDGLVERGAGYEGKLVEAHTIDQMRVGLQELCGQLKIHGTLSRKTPEHGAANAEPCGVGVMDET